MEFRSWNNVKEMGDSINHWFRKKTGNSVFKISEVHNGTTTGSALFPSRDCIILNFTRITGNKNPGLAFSELHSGDDLSDFQHSSTPWFEESWEECGIARCSFNTIPLTGFPELRIKIAESVGIINVKEFLSKNPKLNKDIDLLLFGRCDCMESVDFTKIASRLKEIASKWDDGILKEQAFELAECFLKIKNKE